MAPTSSRVSAGKLLTTPPATRRFMSKPAANTHRNRTVVRADIVPGAVFPDYELPDHANTRRRLSELQGEDPMILTLGSRPLLPQRTPAAFGTRGVLPKDSGRLHAGRDDCDRRPSHPSGIPGVRW